MKRENLGTPHKECGSVLVGRLCGGRVRNSRRREGFQIREHGRIRRNPCLVERFVGQASSGREIRQWWLYGYVVFILLHIVPESYG